jgi:hypothetical protein
MRIDKSAGCPTCSWVPVTDAAGRVHMEARWSTPDHADVRAAAAAAVPATAA